jgi:alpha-glucosidase
MLSLFLGALYVLGTSALGGISFSVQHVVLGSKPAPNGAVATFYMMAGLGYTLGSLQESDIGLTAQLTPAGPSCNAFEQDISDLTIEVTYQSLSTYMTFRVLCVQYNANRWSQFARQNLRHYQPTVHNPRIGD